MEDRIKYTLDNTEIIKPPTQLLDVYKSTTIHYYLLTDPVYSDFIKQKETVIREGGITWEQPRIITSSYLLRMEGFSREAKEAFHIMARENPTSANLLYKMQYKKENENMNIVPHSFTEVSRKINQKIERSNDPFL